MMRPAIGGNPARTTRAAYHPPRALSSPASSFTRVTASRGHLNLDIQTTPPQKLGQPGTHTIQGVKPAWNTSRATFHAHALCVDTVLENGSKSQKALVCRREELEI